MGRSTRSMSLVESGQAIPIGIREALLAVSMSECQNTSYKDFARPLHRADGVDGIARFETNNSLSESPIAVSCAVHSRGAWP